MRKKIVYFIIFFLIGCAVFQTQDLRLPPHLLTYAKYNFRKISNDKDASFVSLATREKIEHVLNEVNQRITKEGGGGLLIDDQNSNVKNIGDFTPEQLKKLDINEMNNHLNSLIKKMFIIRYAILAGSIYRLDKEFIEGFINRNLESGINREISKYDITKYQNGYLMALGSLYYYYTLVTHLNSEIDPSKSKYFSFYTLKGLDLIIPEPFTNHVDSNTGVSQRRMTPPQFFNKVTLENHPTLDLELERHFGANFDTMENDFHVFKNHYKQFDLPKSALDEAIDKIGVEKLDSYYKKPNLIAYTMSPENKFTFEYIALRNPTDAEGVAKLNQLTAIREALVNNWAINRLKDTPGASGYKKILNLKGTKGLADLQAPINENFLTFKSTGKYKQEIGELEYSRNLWKTDFYLNHLPKIVSHAMEPLLDTYLGEDLKSKSIEEKKISSTARYLKMMEEVILYYDEEKNMPRKLTEIMTSRRWEDSIEEMRDRVKSGETFQSIYEERYGSEKLLENEEDLRINEISLNNIHIYGKNKLSKEYITAMLVHRIYSKKKYALLSFLMDKFSHNLFLVKKYSARKGKEITALDKYRISKYFSNKIDKKFGLEYLHFYQKLVYDRICDYFVDIEKNNYTNKLEKLYNMVNTPNMKVAIQVLDKKNKDKTLMVPVTSDKTLKAITSHPSDISRNRWKSQAIDKHLFTENGGSQFKILSEFYGLITKYHAENIFITEAAKDGFENIDQNALSDQMWEIVKSSLVELKNKYNANNDHYEKQLEIAYERLGELKRMGRKVTQDLSKVDNKPRINYRTGQRYGFVTDWDLNKLDSNFAVSHLAAKFELLDFNISKRNMFHESTRLIKIIARSYVDSLIELEPFFNSRFDELKSAIAGHGGLMVNTSKTIQVTFFDKLAKEILRKGKIEKSSVKKYYDIVIKQASKQEYPSMIKSFMQANYRNWKDDKDFENIYFRTKHIREQILEKNEKLASLSKVFCRHVDTYRHFWQRGMVFAGLAFILIIGSSVLVSIIGAGIGLVSATASAAFTVHATAISGFMMSGIFMGGLGLFFASLTVYELRYAWHTIPTELDTQKNLVAANNLKYTLKFKPQTFLNIDSIERINTEESEANFDANMALVFLITDIAWVKYMARTVRDALGIGPLKYLKKISRSKEIQAYIKNKKIRRLNTSRAKILWEDTREVFKLTNTFKIPVDPQQLKTVFVDGVVYAIRNSIKNFKVARNLKHLSVSSQNAVHFFTELNQVIDAKLVKDLTRRNMSRRFGERLKTVSEYAKDFKNSIGKSGFSKEEMDLLNQLAKSIDDLEKFALPTEVRKTLPKFDLNGTGTDLSEKYFDVLFKYYSKLDEVSDVLPGTKYVRTADKVKAIQDEKSLETLAKLTDLKSYQSKLANDLYSGKITNTDEALKLWEKFLKAQGDETTEILEELLTSQSIGDMAFEALLESRWQSIPTKLFKIVPDSFIKAIYEDLWEIRRVKEIIVSGERLKFTRSMSAFSKKVLKYMGKKYNKYFPLYPIAHVGAWLNE